VTLRVVEHAGHRALEDRWDLVHRHALGRAGEAFAAGVERGALVAARCPSCSRVLLPPRSFCERCFRPTELVDFEAREGELLSFTVVRQGFTDSPPAPFAIGYARLDGADTALGALVDPFDAARPDGGLRIGMRVTVRIRHEGFGIERVRFVPAT
jgi:uncharacterized OB-fold protein